MLYPKSSDKYTDFVRDNLLVSDLYIALAEEASELAQAAAKQGRILIGNNPSPVSKEDGESNVLEELADVYVCANVLYGRTKDDYVSDVMNRKLARWVNRLSDNEDVTDVQTHTGYKDVFGQVVYVGDVLYGNTDNKPWKVIGTTPEHDPYNIACVKLSETGSCSTVHVNNLSSAYWDSYDKVVYDIARYQDTPKTYCEQFNLTSKFEYADKLTANTRMRHHLGERLQRL